MAYDVMRRRQVEGDWSMGSGVVYEKRGDKWFRVEEVAAPPEAEKPKEPFKPRTSLWPWLLGAGALVAGLSVISHRGQHQIHARVAREQAMAGG